MAGIDTSNILQPGAISVEGGVTRALISDLQLLTPQVWSKYVEKYGSEASDYFFQFMATFGGMELVKNRQFEWFENRGKLMVGVTPAANVSAAVAGGSITVTLASGDHYNSGTQSPLREGETVRVASTNVEGEILSIDDSTPSAHTFIVRPKKSTDTLASAGSTSLLATDTLLFGGLTDVGEASDSKDPLIHLDERFTNTTTEIRESWAATDRAEMTEVYYKDGISGSVPAGGAQSGTSLFTLKGLKKSNQRFLNNMENKLMRGDVVNNTGLGSSTSVGTQGFIPKVEEDGESVTYTAGSLDIAKLHEITRIMDVNGCAKENLWLMDIYQRQDFSDGIFQQFPAGAWVWGSNERSQEAAIAYGVQSCLIDGYLFKAKKYKYFNSEVSVGKTPATDYFRNYGIICPQGSVADSKDSTKVYKNIQVMYENPPAGGSIGNGIRVWQHGGGSRNPTNGKMEDKVEMISYRGVRVAGANQFIVVNG
jgi:hypothetical protein